MLDELAFEPELARVKADVRAHPERLDPALVAKVYIGCGCEVAPGPWHPHAPRVVAALNSRKPFSVIRIGDGEVHMLGGNGETPHLDRLLLERVMAGHTDRVALSEDSPVRLRRMLLCSIESADIIGVRGIDTPNTTGGVTERLDAIDRDVRGGVGVYRAIANMLGLAHEGLLQGKTVASAHLYFGFLSALDECIEAAQGVLCITSRPSVAADMGARHAKPVDVIQTGIPGPSGEFLERVRSEMPSNLGGILVLVGGGVWSEAYCRWAKKRGGVAVDIGSGFDLLAGVKTRPIHRRLANPRTL